MCLSSQLPPPSLHGHTGPDRVGSCPTDVSLRWEARSEVKGWRARRWRSCPTVLPTIKLGKTPNKTGTSQTLGPLGLAAMTQEPDRSLCCLVVLLSDVRKLTQKGQRSVLAWLTTSNCGTLQGSLLTSQTQNSWSDGQLGCEGWVFAMYRA